MAVAGEVVLRLRVCLGGDCHATFFLCSRCDRGQRTAARHVAARHAFISIDAPTAVTSRARKAGSIIPTGNGNTAGVACERA